MSNLKFAETHNLVAFLEKPEESDGFEGIIDFLNASSIIYVLMVNPIIYTSCIKQFWATTMAKTVNGEKKQPRRKQRKDTEVPQPSGSTEPITDEAANEEHVRVHSNDLLLSGEDRLKLNELMELCTNLSQRVLDLENTKTSQAVEIAKLKEKVKKLERRSKSRTLGLKRLRKVGRSAQVVSSKDEEVTLVDEAQGRIDDNLMFDTGVFDEQEVEVEKVVTTAEVTIAIATTTTINELTLAQTLKEIKAAKLKAVTTAATTTTTAVTRPKARGFVDNTQAMLEADYEFMLKEYKQKNRGEFLPLKKDQKSQTLFAAIQTRFGGNEATKKTQKTLLKQMYENSSASSTESLDSIFNRLQKIWNTHVVVWRNKPDLDTMSFDDLYNNFKIVEQEVKGTASSSSSSSSSYYNMAFVSSPRSTNEVNTAYGVSTANTQVSPASTQVSTASTQVSTANLSDDTVYAFLAS
ncbi:hypothetical protein Tco_1492792 [Tanacetum coccineum]